MDKLVQGADVSPLCLDPPLWILRISTVCWLYMNQLHPGNGQLILENGDLEKVISSNYSKFENYPAFQGCMSHSMDEFGLYAILDSG